MFDFITDRLEGMLGGWAGGARLGFLAGFVIFGALSLFGAFSSGALMADGGSSLITAAGAGLLGGMGGAFAASTVGLVKGLIFGTGQEEAAEAGIQHAKSVPEPVVARDHELPTPGPTPKVKTAEMEIGG